MSENVAPMFRAKRGTGPRTKRQRRRLAERRIAEDRLATVTDFDGFIREKKSAPGGSRQGPTSAA